MAGQLPDIKGGPPTVRERVASGGDLDSLCDEFERRWQGESAPILEDYLAEVAWRQTPNPEKLLEELVCLDLEHCWRRHAVRAADRETWRSAAPDVHLPAGLLAKHYTAKFLPPQAPTPVPWLRVEYRCRRLWGDRPSDADFLAAHGESPELAAAIAEVDAECGVARQLPTLNLPPTGSSVACPHCRAEVGKDGSLRSGSISCQHCGKTFHLVGADPAASIDRAMTIDRFELLTLLGSGGFGVVWKARDTRIDRLVAIKFPRQGVLTEQDVNRIQREATAVARLSHPNIVPLYEVGLRDGVPYLVTAFVDGVSMADRSGGKMMAARDSAVFCRKLADALHYAHEMGVVHRDVKPANVMIDAAWEPHLMDFGLAKREVAEITLTVEGQILGTPAYMSPEQARGRGDQADRRADIYAVGAMLFELLTGELPFRGALQMLLRQVIHEEPPQPRSLNRDVPLDLQTICLKCLEKDPARRYQTARDLSDDLGRFLNREPIAARPVGALERRWRWCVRNPLAASLAATAIGALAAVAVVSTIAYVKTSRALEEKRQSALTSEEVSGFLEGMFRTSSPFASDDEAGFFFSFRDAADADPTARTLLDRGADRIRNELGNQPRVQARLLTSMGNSYHGLGAYDKAAELFREALAIELQLQPVDPLAAALATHRLSSSLGYAGNYEEAEQQVREAIRLVAAAGERGHMAATSMKMSLGMLMLARNKFDDAEDLLTQVVADREQLRGPADPSVIYALQALAAVYLNSGRQEDANGVIVRVLQSAAVARNGDWNKAADVVGNYQRGLHQLNIGHFSEAAGLLEESSREISALLGADHPFAGILQFEYGRALWRTGDHARAIAAFERAEKLGRNLVSSTHPLLLFGRFMLAAVHYDAAQWQRAETLLDDMRPDSLLAWGKQSWQHADVCALSAAVQFQRHGDERALPFIEEALAAENAKVRPVDKNLSEFRCELWRTLAENLLRLNRPDDAAAAIAIAQAISVRNDAKVAVRAPLEIVHARIMAASGDLPGAAALLKALRKTLELPESASTIAMVDAAIDELDSQSGE